MSEQRDVIVTNLRWCARCHGDGHENLAFERLTHPMMGYQEDVGPIEMTHWSMCPTISEPIMMAPVQKTEVVE